MDESILEKYHKILFDNFSNWITYKGFRDTD